MCAKRALPKLKVAEDWFAPTNRIDFEAAYYRFANTVEPDATPTVLGHDPVTGVLVTEYLSSSDYTVWKEELQNGIIRLGHVQQLAKMLRHLHDASRVNPKAAETFNQPDLIHPLRLSPYFLASISAHTDLEDELTGLVNLFETSRLWVIHGDLSPKNILFGPDHPVILDAECANLGDAAFDLAFCGAHLFLKAVWKPEYASKYEDVFEAFCAAYFETSRNSDFEARAVRYLSGLLLARIDGKSPVEYITSSADKNAIRSFARAQLKQPDKSLRSLSDKWFPRWAAQFNNRKTQS